MITLSTVAKRHLFPFLTRFLLLSFSMLVVTFLLHGWSYETTSAFMFALLLFGLLSASVDLILKREPLQKMIPNPGIVKFFVNALLLIFISKVVPSFFLTKTSAAFWGSFGIIFVFSLLTHKSYQKKRTTSPNPSAMKEARARVVE